MTPRNWTVLLIGLALLFIGILEAKRRTHQETGFVSESSWETQLEPSLSTAKLKKIPVVVDFTASWCEPCAELDREVFNDPDVKKKLESFVRIRLDVSEDTPETEAWMRQFHVLSLPTVQFFSSAGEPLPQFAIEAVVTPAEFNETLEAVIRH